LRYNKTVPSLAIDFTRNQKGGLFKRIDCGGKWEFNRGVKTWLLILVFVFQVRGFAGELWLYCSQNLWVDKNVAELEGLFARASKAGYTHVLLSDSKFSKLDDMDARYFANVERMKRAAKENHLEIVPALFSVGYSNDLLWHDPNLVEALPVRDVEMVARGEVAELAGDGGALMKGGDFGDLKLWGWHDEAVKAEEGAVVIRDPKGTNARISQKVTLKPWRQYHFSVRVKTKDFKGAKAEVKFLAPDGRALDWNELGVKTTQDWTTHHVVFHSLGYTNANLYLGAWGANSGELWFDDAKLEETMFVNLVRRPGAPLKVLANGKELKEGADFEELRDVKMGNRVWPGSYDVWHEAPKLKLKGSVADGTKLRVSCYDAVTVNDDQAMICPSEPKTMELLRDQARRMHKAWGAKGYMMSHDEIRVLNWCEACEKRHLTAGQILAENARECVKILREVNPGGRIYVWSDMFDPNHNAHDNYYLVRGTLAGSWEGLDKEVTILPWYFEKRAESLRFFAGRGHKQVIAGYYDHKPEQIKEWLKAAEGVEGVEGVMYTTWVHRYSDMEAFAAAAGIKK
jgi:hypothetical protein